MLFAPWRNFNNPVPQPTGSAPTARSGWIEPVRRVRIPMLRAGGVPRLRDLQLNHCELGNDGAAALAEVLRDGYAPNLQNLWLGGNMIGDYGAEELASAVTPGVGRGLGLRRLALYANVIADAGALALATALEARGREREGRMHDLPSLTIMLEGHKIREQETLQVLYEVDEVGARQLGDRFELEASSSAGTAMAASPQRGRSPSRAASPYAGGGNRGYEFATTDMY